MNSSAVEQFDEFFESGLEQSVSPFLFPHSRRWGMNLPLKASLISAGLLFIAFIFSFFPTFRSFSHLLLLLTYFFAGIPALISSIEDLLSFQINIDVLMTLAAFLSVLVGSGMEGALLLVLFSLSGSMEESVRSRAKSAISSLKKIAPQKACVVQPDESLVERSIRDIGVGTKIHVKAGQLVPLDGKVIEGASSVNLVHLTGESLPLSRKKGDEVPAGARNLEGGLTLVVTHTSSDSTLARIIQLIVQAQESKPKLQRWLDRVSNVYALSIISLAFVFAFTLPLLFHIPFLGAEGSIYRALAFLIASSPCALIIAIPIAYLSAVSACAKKGILLKGGMVLDALARCQTIALDKTGTLTTGELHFLGISQYGENLPALNLVYALERSCVHPIATAVVQHAYSQNVRASEITEWSQVPGYGVQALFEGEPVFMGNAEWIFPKIPEELKPVVEAQMQEIRQKGELLTLLLYRSSVSVLRFRDTLRPHIVETIKKLQPLRVVMLTGDHQESARSIAEESGISEFHAGLRPEDKLAFISDKKNLAMVGDGINDAPALARANVGIAMGRVGSTTAVDAADIVLLQDRIERLPWLIGKANQVRRIVKQNLFIAAGAIVFASTPALFGWIPLWLAVILHEGGTVIVGLNALRLLKRGENHVDGAKVAIAAAKRGNKR